MGASPAVGKFTAYDDAEVLFFLCVVSIRIPADVRPCDGFGTPAVYRCGTLGENCLLTFLRPVEALRGTIEALVRSVRSEHGRSAYIR